MHVVRVFAHSLMRDGQLRYCALLAGPRSLVGREPSWSYFVVTSLVQNRQVRHACAPSIHIALLIEYPRGLGRDVGIL